MANPEQMLDVLARQVEKMTIELHSLQARVNNLEKSPSSSMIKSLEKIVQKSTNPTFYQESPTYNSNLSSKLSEEFSATDLPKFKPTDDPRFHHRGFRATMALKGIDPSLFPIIFPLSLEPVCQKWYFSFPDKNTTTWEDITQAFMTRYKGNIQTQTSL
ncbi:Transcription factor UNE10 [Bienertia sinuspersici]